MIDNYNCTINIRLQTLPVNHLTKTTWLLRTDDANLESVRTPRTIFILSVITLNRPETYQGTILTRQEVHGLDGICHRPRFMIRCRLIYTLTAPSNDFTQLGPRINIWLVLTARRLCTVLAFEVSEVVFTVFSRISLALLLFLEIYVSFLLSKLNMCIASSADIETVSLWDNGGEKVIRESNSKIINKFFYISLFCV